MKNQWVRAGLFLLFLFVASRLVPPDPVDPWGLFRPQKILFMFFALSALQVAGEILSLWVGPKAGIIMTGFLGELNNNYSGKKTDYLIAERVGFGDED